MIFLDRIEYKGVDMMVVRDDLFPAVGGGNKARKMVEYERDIIFHQANALVTTGGIQSNHCRAVALMAAKNHWKCHVVYHGTKERFDNEKGNALLVRMAGASVDFVSPDKIGLTMDSAMERFRENGFTPYYVTGGGHDIPGGAAYVKAIIELQEVLKPYRWKPDYIFFASGTGSTQCGIILGLHLVGWDDVKAIGISIARKKQRGVEVMNDYIDKLCSYYHIKEDLKGKIIFNDDYIDGGYEKKDESLDNMLNNVAQSTGIILDSTYSGKAFYGMMQMIENTGIKGNILFWHTGGIMNIQK